MKIDDQKDALLGWAYRELQRTQGITYKNGDIGYPSSVLEFFDACEKVVPDIEVFAAMAREHPGAILHAEEGQ